MTARSGQAKKLAQSLARWIGVDPWKVTAQYVTYPAKGYQFQWPSGPTADQMRKHAQRLVASGQYPELAGVDLMWSRSTGPRDWAARAVAAYREGTWRPAIERDAAYRRAHPTGIDPGDWTPEDHAALQFVGRLIDETPFPDQASDPSDEPMIARLLAVAGKGSERDMARLLLAGSPFVLDGKLPDDVVPLRRREGGTR